MELSAAAAPGHDIQRERNDRLTRVGPGTPMGK